MLTKGRCLGIEVEVCWVSSQGFDVCSAGHYYFRINLNFVVVLPVLTPPMIFSWDIYATVI